MVAASKECMTCAEQLSENSLLKILHRLQGIVVLTLREEMALLVIRPDEYRTAYQWNVPTTIFRDLQGKGLVAYRRRKWGLTEVGKTHRLNLYKDWCKLDRIDDDYDEF